MAIPLAVLACASGTSEVLRTAEFSPAGLTLSIDKSAYIRADLDPGSGNGVRATLLGSTERSYYSRLGDAFNAALDQNPLFVAEGSDGSLERQSGNSWIRVAGVPLVEGVRDVVISTSKSYGIIAHASPPIQAGTYRMTIKLRDAVGGPVIATISSPPFEVR
jgi:hypothetical protein